MYISVCTCTKPLWCALYRKSHDTACENSAESAEKNRDSAAMMALRSMYVRKFIKKYILASLNIKQFNRGERLGCLNASYATDYSLL